MRRPAGRSKTGTFKLDNPGRHSLLPTQDWAAIAEDLAGAGTLGELRARAIAWFGVAVTPDGGGIVLFMVAIGDRTGLLAVSLQAQSFA